MPAPTARQVSENNPTFAQQIEEWERATRERGTDPTNHGVDRGVNRQGSQRGSAGKRETLKQQRARREQLRAYEAILRPATPREQKLDRLEKEVQHKLREPAGSVANAAAEATVRSHKKTAVRAKNKNWRDGQWGSGYGNSWLNSEAHKAAKKALHLKADYKPTEADLKEGSKYALAYWAAHAKITETLDGLHEMSCLTMMTETLRAYTRATAVLTQNGALEQQLNDSLNKAKDARSVGKKAVEEARGTVVLEELRTKFGFETVHIDAVPKDPKKYWNNQKVWNYSSDSDAHNKDNRLPKQEDLRKVEGAITHEQVDVSVGVDHFVKLSPKMSAESNKWWKVLNETEFAVGVADQGYHTFAISRGFVYEVHWDRGPDDPTLTGKRSLKDFFNPNRAHGTGWSSGIIAVPPEALPKSRK